MSSCKLWRRDGHVGQSRDNGSSRKPHSLLRLDSTGEVTSVKPYSAPQPAKMCPERKKCCFSCNPRNLSFQSVGFKMSSMIDTANSYLNTATSYLESIYPAKTRKCLDDTSTTDSMNLEQYFDNNCMMPTISKGVEGPCLHAHGAGNHNSTMGCDFAKGLKKTWPHDIIGALKSTVFSQDTSHASSFKSDRYIPPPIKHRLLQQKQFSAAVKDPKLTPYNAKLLEKSKRRDSSPNKPSQNGTKVPDTVEPENHTDKVPSVPDMEINKSQMSTSDSQMENTAEEDPSGFKHKDIETTDDSSSPSVPDWFEYENSEETTIPLSVNVEVLHEANKCDKVSKTDTESDTQDRMLHSWYSMENDKDVIKPRSASNNPSSHNLCDKNEHSVNDPCSIQVVNNENNAQEVSEIRESKLEAKAESVTKTDNVPKKQSKSNDRKTHLMSVLFIRNCAGQRSRPSAQKRSRHKAQKETCNDSSTSSRTKPLKDGNSVHPKSSVSFILGLDHDRQGFSKQSFQVTCDIDDLDWSSSDEDEDQFDDVDGCGEFNFFSPLSLVNLQVTCSVPSGQPTSYNTTNSLLDRINQEWEMNVSIKPEYPEKKTNCSKKVHFKDDNSLSTVHPMVAWSYAYQAARKGPWEEIARDRGRFQRRITDGEKLLKPILQTTHRNQIFKDRFENDQVDY